MSRLLKVLLFTLGGIVALVLISAVALLLFFDPNDFRDDIELKVEQATGRELEIEGDLSLSVFPWLAVEVGRSTLGNAAGFGTEPFARFERASLSVRLVPLLTRREIAVGTASLDALELNLAVNADGTTNWDDLAQAGEAPAETPAGEGGGPAGLDIASVAVTNATIRYTDKAAGSQYLLDHVSLATGRIAFGAPFEVKSEFDFSATAGELGGHLATTLDATLAGDMGQATLRNLTVQGNLRGIAKDATEFRFTAPVIDVDLDASRVDAGALELAVLGLTIKANVQPFSWAGEISIPAHVEVAQFSLKRLLPAVDIEAPLTADPDALQEVSFSADAAITPEALALKSLTLRLDDTQMTGDLLLPLGTTEPIRFALAADRINLDRYMAPALEAGTPADKDAVDDFEIPVDTIRSLQASGSLTVQEALLAGMTFTNLKLGLVSGGGKMHLQPLSAELFDGTYKGDVRIDASGDTPTMSFDEHIDGVSLAPLAQAMFDQEHITGAINGNFAIDAAGKSLSDMRRKMNGKMSFELLDGTWEGTDLWYQLRNARAIYKHETPPEAQNPPRTKFTSIAASGTIKDGVFANDDLLAELPFLQLTGNGTVNLVEGVVDYKLQARVLEKPEFVRGASDAELSEFTEALIPVRIRGPLADPSVRPDIEAMFRKEVEDTLEKKGDELKKRLLDQLSGSKDKEAAAEDQAAEDKKKSAEDELKDKLKKLFD